MATSITPAAVISAIIGIAVSTPVFGDLSEPFGLFGTELPPSVVSSSVGFTVPAGLTSVSYTHLTLPTMATV